MPMILQTQAADLLLGEVELRLRKRYAMSLYAVSLGRVADQSSPSATNVEQSLIRL
jgi:hypothetical protein